MVTTLTRSSPKLASALRVKVVPFRRHRSKMEIWKRAPVSGLTTQHSPSPTRCYSLDSSAFSTATIRIYFRVDRKAIRSLHHNVFEKETRRRFSPTSLIYVPVSSVPMSTLLNSSFLNWERAVVWMVQGVWSSEVASNKSKLRTCCGDTSASHLNHRGHGWQLTLVAVEYVTCKTCRSPDTELSKGENRLYFVSCNSCQSRRSVTAIKVGFTAQVGKRKRQQV